MTYGLFPSEAWRAAGHQIDLVQRGQEPDDWKPLSSVGQGVREIRIWDEAGTFRVVYVARFADAVYVLHCFQKKTHKTAKTDLGSGGQTLPRVVEGDGQMSKQRFASVWDAIEDTSEAAENMKLRSVLMIALKEHVVRAGLSQSQAAKVFGVTQPRVSDLMRGKIDLFGLDALVNMAAAAGLRIDLQISEPA